MTDTNTTAVPPPPSSEVQVAETIGPGDPFYDLTVNLQRELGADRCTFYILDQDKHEVWSKVALGLEGAQIRVGIHRGLVGYVARTGKTVLLKDVYNDPRFNRNVDTITGYRTKSALTMAIRIAVPGRPKRVAGVLQALNKHTGLFTEADEQTMARYCEQAAALLG
jgi:GAF domain-containing protein